MPTYISLFNWTQQGMEKIRESPARLDKARQTFRELGADIKGFYTTMGRYDMVIIWEAPDDQTAARAALAIGSKGSTRSETLRAFREDEYRQIIEALP